MEERIIMSREVVKHFICCGKQMVIVELENSAHVMTLEEWKRVYGKLHPERWENSKGTRKSRKIA